MKKLNDYTLNTISGGGRGGCAASVIGSMVMGIPAGPWAVAGSGALAYLRCPVNAR